MQEVMKNGSHGKTFVKDSIEALVPHIKESLENPDVKYIKIFKARGPIKNEEIFSAEEEVITMKDLNEMTEFHFRIHNEELFDKWCKKHNINRFSFSFSVKGQDVKTCDFFDITNNLFYTPEQVEKEMGEPVFSLSRY